MLEGKRAVVVGASRGLGRGVAQALSASGASVVAIGRDRDALEEIDAAHQSISVLVADANDPSVAGDVVSAHDPDVLAVVAGAAPPMHPIHQHTWETFSQPWDVDVRITFYWLREALSKPLRPGSRVLVMSSGAALAGSPLSGGYAGAKATIRFMAAYADEEARRADLGISVTAGSAQAHACDEPRPRRGPRVRGPARRQRGTVRPDTWHAGNAGVGGRGVRQTGRWPVGRCRRLRVDWRRDQRAAGHLVDLTGGESDRRWTGVGLHKRCSPNAARCCSGQQPSRVFSRRAQLRRRLLLLWPRGI